MDKIKIIKKNDEYSSEYQIGDTFEIRNYREIIWMRSEMV